MNPQVQGLVSGVLGGWVRHGLSGLGAVLGVQGLNSDSNVNLFVGLGLFGISLAWSAAAKYLTPQPSA